MIPLNVLECSVTIASRGKNLVAIDRVRIPQNRIMFLFGESGIGKSLIAKAIYGVLDPEDLEITINGEPYEAYRERPACREIRENSFFVFQEPSSHLNPLMTLNAQISEGSLAEAPRGSNAVDELWSRTGQQEIRNLFAVYPKPYRPSGGEKQRVLLLMAFKRIDAWLESAKSDGATLFVFDEPTGSLDDGFRNIVLSLLFQRYRKKMFTALVISHDYSMISVVFDRHKELRDRVSFKEIRLQRQGLVLEDFLPETYLSWLKSQRPPSGSLVSPGPPRGHPLLRLESGMRVFGRTLTISRDEAGQDVCPLEIPPGTMVYLKAPSGTGKTTLVKLVMGLLRAEHLRLSVDGMIITEETPRTLWQEHLWGRKMAIVFQHADEALNLHSTVRETFSGLPLQERPTDAGIAEMLGDLFDHAIDDSFLRRKVKALSGGQKQRLNLLRSLCLNTDILILDEPLNGLDFSSATKVIAMVRERQQRGKGILLISHNEEIFDTQVPEEQVYYLHAERNHPA